MTITYEEALSTLQSMFTDQGYTTQQLDAVLRHHGGHMEHTVETLLGHGDGSPEELMAKLKDIPVGGPSGNTGSGATGGAGGPGAAGGIDADEELARQLAAEEDSRGTGRSGGRGAAGSGGHTTGRSTYSGAGGGGGRGAGGAGGAVGLGGSLVNAHARWTNPPGQRRPVNAPVPQNSSSSGGGPTASTIPAPQPPVPKGRGTPTILPSDFLRIPGRKYPTSPSSGAGGVNAVANAAGGTSMMTDEQLARMLQDELFQEELRNNPEFSHLAGRRQPTAAGAYGAGHTTGRSNYAGAGAVSGGGFGGWNERTDFFERLSELGDNAKRRFQEFAASWGDPHGQQSQRGGGMGGMGGMGGRGGNERRGLLSGDLNMEEEEEMNFVGSGGGGGEFVELGDVRGGGSGGSADKKKD